MDAAQLEEIATVLEVYGEEASAVSQDVPRRVEVRVAGVLLVLTMSAGYPDSEPLRAKLGGATPGLPAARIVNELNAVANMNLGSGTCLLLVDECHRALKEAAEAATAAAAGPGDGAVKFGGGDWSAAAVPLGRGAGVAGARELNERLRGQIDTYHMTVQEKAGTLTRRQRAADRQNRDCGVRHAKEVAFCVDDAMYERMAALQAAAGERHCPLLTFHGTDSVETAQSILKHGYLLPGEPHPVWGADGCCHPRHGKFYGTGVYTTTRKELAACYSTLDARASAFLVVNLVFLGDVAWLAPGEESGEVIPNGDHVYEGGAHTRALPDLAQVVAANPARVFPVGYVIDLAASYTRAAPVPRWSDVYVDPTLPPARCTRIARNYYLVVPPPLPRPRQGAAPPRHLVVASARDAAVYEKQLAELTARLLASGAAACVEFFVYAPRCVHTTRCHNAAMFKKWTRDLGFSTALPKRPGCCLAGLEAAMEATRDGAAAGGQVIYTFVDNAAAKADTDAFVQRWYAHAHDSLAGRLHVKLVITGSDYDNCWLSLRSLDSALADSWMDYFRTYQAVEADDWNRMLDENARLADRWGIPAVPTYRVPYYEKVFGEGLVTDLALPPASEATTAAPALLLKDTQRLRALVVNGTAVRVVDAAAAEDDTDAWFAVLAGLLSRLRLTAMRDRERYVLYMPAVALLCKSVAERIDAAPWHFSARRKMHFLISKYVDDFARMSSVRFKGRLFARFQEMRFGARALRRSKAVDLGALKAEMGPARQVCHVEDALPLLSDVVGVGVMTVDAEASVAEPWNLIITYVSRCTFSLAEVYRHHELGLKLLDAAGRRVNNILVTALETLPPQIKKIYFAYTFTRNPYLVLSGQCGALYATAAGYLCERALISCAGPAPPPARADLARTVALAVDLLLLTRPHPAVAAVLEECTDGAVPWDRLRAAGMVSATQALVALVDPARYRAGDRFEMAFGLLCEAVRKAGRVYLKVTKASPASVLTELFGTGALDAARARSMSMRFFRRRYTANSPYSIVAVLGVLAHMHTEGDGPASRAALAQKFAEKAVSMRGFLERYFTRAEAEDVQVACFLQGVVRGVGGTRFEPTQIIAACAAKHAANQALREQQQQAVAQAKTARKGVLAAKRLAKAAEMAAFCEAHRGWPKLFTAEEVATLNVSRPPGEQLVRRRNGLLAHYCCFPECPYFLTKRMEPRAVHAHCNYIGVYLLGDYVKAHEAAACAARTEKGADLTRTIAALGVPDAEARRLTDFYAHSG